MLITMGNVLTSNANLAENTDSHKYPQIMFIICIAVESSIPEPTSSIPPNDKPQAPLHILKGKIEGQTTNPSQAFGQTNGYPQKGKSEESTAHTNMSRTNSKNK